MPSIEEEIVTWLNGRPDWQKALAANVVAGEEADEEFAEALAADLIDKKRLEVPGVFKPEDLPISASTGSRVELVNIGELQNVNALADGETLEFAASGLTVIYGDNGSGKSGYARLIKDSVGARHHQQILPNAFNPAGSTKQSAIIKYRVDGEDRELEWPRDVDPDLTQVRFHDEACGDDYLMSSTELSYRPSALTFFDKLIVATDTLRGAVDRRLTAVTAPAYSVPGMQPDTTASVFAKSVGADTTEEQIDAAVSLADDAEQQLALLVQNEAPSQYRSVQREVAT